ncbi:MAG: LptF/LptG family permease [Bacteroidetes bacterium]|nr:LptF/LptG family permease [Bacteroidota bacterium]
MKHIDRYITKQFLTSFAFGLLAFLLLFIIIDMMEKLDDFIDANVPTNIVIHYYVVFSPEILKLMTPVATLLAALFVTGRLSGHNELAAMKASGISLYRYMAPFFLIATLICAFSIYFNGWIVPYANQKRLYIERTYLHQNVKQLYRFNLFFQVTPTTVVTVHYYDTQRKIASSATVIELAHADSPTIVRRYDAQHMVWNDLPHTGEGQWILKKVVKQEFLPSTVHYSVLDSINVGNLSLTPYDIEKKQLTPDEMDLQDLREFIANQERIGQDVARWLVEYHFKIAFPFASIIMILFGVPFASSRPRTGAALGFGIAVAVTFIYLGFMKASQVFGYNGDLNPVVTAWLGNCIFLVAGIINLLRVQK